MKGTNCPPPPDLVNLVETLFDDAKWVEDDDGRYLFTLSSGKPSKGGVYELLGPNRQFSTDKSNWKTHKSKPKDPSLQLKFTNKLIRFFSGKQLSGVISPGFEGQYEKLQEYWRDQYGEPPGGTLGQLIIELERYDTTLRRHLNQNAVIAGKTQLAETSIAFSPNSSDRAGSKVAGLELPPTFIGRQQELDRVIDLVRQGKGIVIIEGMPGVGKSSIAYRVVAEMTAMNDGLRTISVTARDGTLNENFFLDTICTYFQYPASTQLPLDEKRKAAESIISNAKAIFLIDNFETCIDRERISIIKFLISSESQAIITARSLPAIVGELDSAVTFVTIAGLPVADALNLILCESDRLSLPFDPRQHANEMRNLVDITAGNPLAIKFVLSRLRASLNTIPQLIADLRGAKLDILNHMFQENWEALNQNAKTALTSTTLFPSPFSVNAIRAASALGGGEIIEALEQLLAYAFIDRSNGFFADVVRLETHPLVSAFAKSKISDINVQKNISVRLGKYFESLSDGDDLVFWEGRKDYAPLESEYLNIVSTAAILWEHDEFQTYARLVRSLADFLYAMGHWGLCLELGENGATAANKAGDIALESWIRVHMMGHLYTNRSDFHRAIEQFELAADLAEQASHPAYQSVALRNIGRAHRKSGRFGPALKAYRLSRRIANAHGLNRELSLTLNELGKLARDINDYQRSMKFFELSLAHLPARDNAIAAGILCNIGGVAISMSDLKKAEDVSRRSHDYFASVGNQEGLASAKWRLALISKMRNDLIYVELARDAMTIFTKLGMYQEVSRLSIELGI